MGGFQLVSRGNSSHEAKQAGYSCEEARMAGYVEYMWRGALAGDGEGGMRVGEGGARDCEDGESGEAARALPGASMRHEYVEGL